MGNQIGSPKKDSSLPRDKSLKLSRRNKYAALWAKKLIKKSYDDICGEYKTLRATAVPPIISDPHPGQLRLNRYRDIICIEKTRVVLKDRPESNNYIHANWVDINENARFIITQGPMQSTIEDFWEMVFTEKIHAILMLCSLCEEGLIKCAEYWPQHINDVKVFGEFRVENVFASLSHSPKVTTSELMVTYKGKQHTLRHYQWQDWPDDDIPKDLDFPFKLLDQAMGSMTGEGDIGLLESQGPTLVHCSAGIGRSGTCAALYLARYALIEENSELKFYEKPQNSKSLMYSESEPIRLYARMSSEIFDGSKMGGIVTLLPEMAR
uniref:Tyrosine-protein phosphatase domain-containing protein n=1 Tax=Rhabditophanes sp. KR3021 TaxID=114890 RepID=A0AC35UG74_9BILA